MQKPEKHYATKTPKLLLIAHFDTAGSLIDEIDQMIIILKTFWNILHNNYTVPYNNANRIIMWCVIFGSLCRICLQKRLLTIDKVLANLCFSASFFHDLPTIQ